MEIRLCLWQHNKKQPKSSAVLRWTSAMGSDELFSFKIDETVDKDKQRIW